MRIERSTIIEKYLEENSSYFSQKEHISSDLGLSVDMSIVIPAYNEQFYLPRLLSLLEYQIYRNFEVVIVDNNSSDQTKDVIGFWQSKVNYPLYQVVEFDKGVANARKRGMDEVLFRAIKRGDGYPPYLIIITDADVMPPSNWLENIHSRTKNATSLALAGTHQAAPEIDLAIEQKLGIKNYFNLIPSLIESFTRNNIGVIKMSGPNSAFEIEAYAAGGGMKQEYDERTGLVKLNEANSLGNRIKLCGYPVMPMNARVITSKRRQLREVLDGGDSYFPNDFSEKARFNVIREDESQLLKLALEQVNRDAWLRYRQRMIAIVLNNLILPALPIKKTTQNPRKLSIQIDRLATHLNKIDGLTMQDLQTLIVEQLVGIVI